MHYSINILKFVNNFIIDKTENFAIENMRPCLREK